MEPSTTITVFVSNSAGRACAEAQHAKNRAYRRREVMGLRDTEDQGV